VFKVQGRGADTHDADFEIQCVSVETGPFESQIEPHRRNTNAPLGDHARPPGAKLLEELLKDAHEKTEIRREIGDAGRITVTEGETPGSAEGQDSSPSLVAWNGWECRGKTDPGLKRMPSRGRDPEIALSACLVRAEGPCRSILQIGDDAGGTPHYTC